MTPGNTQNDFGERAYVKVYLLKKWILVTTIVDVIRSKFKWNIVNTYLDLQKSSKKSRPPMWPYHQCWVSFMFCNLKPSIPTPIQKFADKPICCALPNNNKSNPWKTTSKCRLNKNLSIHCRHLILFKTKTADTPICCSVPNNNKSNPWKTSKDKTNYIDYLNQSQTDCLDLNIQTKIADKPICCTPPNNNKQNILKTFLKCRLN